MKATAGQRVRFDIPLSVARVCGYLTRGGILCHLFARKGSGVSVARVLIGEYSAICSRVY